VLQHVVKRNVLLVAAGCSELRCVAECCRVLQCVVVCCGVLQWDAVCCSVLQCVAVAKRNVVSCDLLSLQKDVFFSLQREMNFAKRDESRVNNERSTSCNKLQQAATSCNTLCVYVVSLQRDVFISLQREMDCEEER